MVGYGGRPPFAWPRWKGESRARLGGSSGVAKARRGWCARAWAETLANGGRSRGRAAVRGEGAADGWDLPVSVLQREGRGRVQRMGRLGPKPSGPAVGAVTFCFSFMQNCGICLILHIKLCTDSKIMEISGIGSIK